MGFINQHSHHVNGGPIIIVMCCITPSETMVYFVTYSYQYPMGFINQLRIDPRGPHHLQYGGFTITWDLYHPTSRCHNPNVVVYPLGSSTERAVFKCDLLLFERDIRHSGKSTRTVFWALSASSETAIYNNHMYIKKMILYPKNQSWCLIVNYDYPFFGDQDWLRIVGVYISQHIPKNIVII